MRVPTAPYTHQNLVLSVLWWEMVDLKTQNNQEKNNLFELSKSQYSGYP